MHAQEMMQAQNRLEKTWSFPLRLISGTEKLYSNKTNKQNPPAKPKGRWIIWFPELTHNKIQMLTFQQKKSQDIQRIRKVWAIQWNKINEHKHTQGSPDIMLTRQTLWNNYIKDAKRAKESHGQIQENDVWTKSEYQWRDIIIKQNSKEFLELKSTIKYTQEGFQSRFEEAEEITNELEGRTIEITESEEQNKNSKKWTEPKWLAIRHIESK